MNVNDLLLRVQNAGWNVPDQIPSEHGWIYRRGSLAMREDVIKVLKSAIAEEEGKAATVAPSSPAQVSGHSMIVTDDGGHRTEFVFGPTEPVISDWVDWCPRCEQVVPTFVPTRMEGRYYRMHTKGSVEVHQYRSVCPNSVQPVLSAVEPQARATVIHGIPVKTLTPEQQKTVADAAPEQPAERTGGLKPRIADPWPLPPEQPAEPRPEQRPPTPSTMYCLECEQQAPVYLTATDSLNPTPILHYAAHVHPDKSGVCPTSGTCVPMGSDCDGYRVRKFSTEGTVAWHEPPVDPPVPIHTLRRELDRLKVAWNCGLVKDVEPISQEAVTEGLLLLAWLSYIGDGRTMTGTREE